MAISGRKRQPRTMRTILVLAPLLLLFSGCTDGGELDVDAMDVSYNGNDSGTHEEKGTCDSDGQLSGSGRIEDGTVRITVKDGGGSNIFERTYDGNIDFKTQSVNGDSGEWTLRAERRGNDLVGDEFKGQYSFHLVC